MVKPQMLMVLPCKTPYKTCIFDGKTLGFADDFLVFSARGVAVEPWQAARLRILGLAPGWRKDTLQGSGIHRCRGRTGIPKKWVISMGIYWDDMGISPGIGKITMISMDDFHGKFPEIMGIHGLNLAQIWRFHGNSWDETYLSSGC